MEIRTVLDLFKVIPAIFDLEVYFSLAMFLFYLFHCVVSNVAILFICVLNISHDGEINIYIRTYIIHAYT